MKDLRIQKPNWSVAFTLVEMLVVIAIIAILAAMILPAIQGAQKAAKVKKAQMEINDIKNAIIRYDTDYHSYPVSGDVRSITSSKKEDFTYFDGNTNMNLLGINNPAFERPNSEVIAILMDWTNTPLATSPVLVTNANVNHQKNPQQNKYLNPSMSGYAGAGIPLPGVDASLIYRDPWGRPYVISMDLNYDEQCWDGAYRAQQVSQESGVNGHYGLHNSIDGSGNGNHFSLNGGVMVWSAGPDQKFDFQNGVPANTGVNKDNVLSWK
jgi:prepilin-type N-terminal cleavage/methylation domain-containing protein